MMRFIWTCASALLLSACAHAPVRDLMAGGHYVNMGSSFAAGAGTGEAPAGSPARCYQSVASYAHLLAARLNLPLTDVSCGGATSAHLLNPWNELPAQIDAVREDTRLVTITVGGNDIAYAGNLVAASCEQGEMIRVGSLSVPCPSPFAVAEEAYATLETNLRTAANAIAARAPRARIVFIQYITLVPQTQCDQSRFTEEEAVALRVVAARLAEITARAARDGGAEVLAVNETSIGRTPCDPAPWSTGLPRDYQGDLAPWHPNRRGMDAIAAQLENLIAS